MTGIWVCLAFLLSSQLATPEQVTGEVKASTTTRIALASQDASSVRTITVWIERPDLLSFGDAVRISLHFDGQRLTKTLHAADPDVAWQIKPSAGAKLALELTGSASLRGQPVVLATQTSVNESPAGVVFEVEPNQTPDQAQPITLGRTVYGLADDRPEYPLGETTTEEEGTAGKDWYRFEFQGDRPRLAYFAIEFVDRDVPPDVRVFRRKSDGQVVEHLEGIDPQSLQRERPPRPGANKFTTRVLKEPGTYFIQVDACHPDYQLRTKLYDVPPYLKPEETNDRVRIAAAARKAIRSSMDFQLLAGDSWHANTPRKGHALDRVANPHHETSTCIACHPTHFTTQSALAAVRNGYSVEEPYALKFLTERLYNNPVPLHGFPDAVWARMIPAPANVLGRLSTMTMDFENLIAGNPRNNTHEAIGRFLSLCYDGRTTIPPDETNGNNPISRYKVATDSWRQLSELVRRTNKTQYAKTRNLVANLLTSGTPDNTRDLAAQTIGLCQVDPIRFRPLIDANVKRLLELQRPDGHWSPKFDPKYPHAAMQTGETLYALRLAGLAADHPAVQKGIVALLREQGTFGGWLDLSKYEQFQTPFRETQWALIALSSFYPGPGTQGWNSPLGPQPTRLDSSSDSTLIRDLERIWDAPTPELLSNIIKSLSHQNLQVRLAACETLGRVGEEESLRPLSGRLADPSKVVRRAAAEGLRSIGNRINSSHPAGATAAQIRFVSVLKEALDSPSALVRRSATRVFAAHFREISQQHELADALLARLDDPDPMVRMGAIKGLWRWWYWQSDLALRNRIEDKLISVLARTEHPWVRRNAIEALYIIGDENIRYLYKNWVPSLALQSTRDRVTQAQHETTARLITKYVAVLRGTNLLQKEGVLRAISEFHERPGGQGRVGNDTEPMLAYDKAEPVLTSALIEQMADAHPLIRRLALEALVAVREAKDPRIPLNVTALQADESAEVRDWATTMAKQFPLRLKAGQPGAEVVALVDHLMKSPRSEAKVKGLTLMGQVGPAPGMNDAWTTVLRTYLKDPDATLKEAAVRALASFPTVLNETETKHLLESAVEASPPRVRAAAVRLALDHPGIVKERVLRVAFNDESAPDRLALLGVIGQSKQDLSDLRLIGVVSGSVVDENGGVREKALQLIQTNPRLVANPAIESGLRELARSDNLRQKEIARTLLASRGRSSGGEGTEDLLDLPYFERKVLPIFSRMGEDGQNCVECHRSHSILKLAPPRADGHWDAQAVRANYRAALRVVNLAQPNQSLLLNKPTWDAYEEAEAQTDPNKKAHAGGIRFEPRKSREYQTILDWINGAKLDQGKTRASSRR